MTDKRLAEIDARRERWASVSQDGGDLPGMADTLARIAMTEDIPWLVSRLRTAMAVVEAARKRSDAEDHLRVIDNSDRVFKPEWTEARRAAAAAADELDAALAALEADDQTDKEA